MRDNDRLTFELLMQYNGEEVSQPYAVHPGYTRLTLGWSKEGDKVYYTKKIGGTLTFLGSEYELIQNQGLLCKFWVVIYDEGVELCRGTFRKTDCKTDRDHERIDVEITADDIYNELESNNSEYNITKWGMEKQQMGINIYPAVEVYPIGSNTLHLFSKGVSHYETTTETSADTVAEAQSYFFAPNIYAVIYLSNEDMQAGEMAFSQDMIGAYAGRWDTTQESILTGVGRNYRISILHLSGSSDNVYNVVLLNSQNAVVCSSNITVDDAIGQTSITFYWGDISNSEHTVKCRFYFACGRITTSKAVSGWYEESDTDIYPTNRRYAAYKTVTLEVSRNVSDTDNGYRPNGEGLWYAPPVGSGEYIPFEPESWYDGVSVWMHPPYLTNIQINTYSDTGDIRDWYLLGDVIGGMLEQIDSSLIWENDTAHSQFLFGTTNPVTGETQGQLYVTQKSNLLNYRYEYPAWNALLTWNRLETVLRDMFNCYYDIYIDGQGRKHFRVEHILFYENGLSYTPQQRNLIDLTAIIDPRNRKPYSFVTDRWSYDKDRPYTRIEFSWMDKQSEPFDAFAVQVPKRYMIYTRNTIDHRDVDWFSSDIDFLLSVPGQASNDGFIIAMSEPGVADADRVVCQGEVTIGSTVYWCQNHRCALGYLQKAFLLYGLYSPYVTMDGDDETLVATPEGGRKKLRMQDVEFDLPKGEVARPESLYRTETGEGLVETLEIDLTCMSVKATLRQPNEELLS